MCAGPAASRPSLISLMVSVDVKHHGGSVPFPPVSLQRQVVCLLLRPVFMCSSQWKAYSFLVGWCTNKSYVIATSVIVQELCESRGGRPGLSVLTSLLVSVDVKNY